MGVLRNGNWEKLCQVYVLDGLDQTAAFRVAYPNNRMKKKSTQRVRACELFRRSEIKERVSELM